MKYYTVKAWHWKDDAEQLSEWATGWSYIQALSYFKSLRDSNQFWKVEMHVQ